MAKFYCILFDADNTILDFDAAEGKALDETLEHFGLPKDAATIEKYREVNSALWASLEKGEIRREKIMAERFPRFLKAIGSEQNSTEMNHFYLEKLATHPDTIPGAAEVLGELAEVATLAVASNGISYVQQQRMKDSGLGEYMEDIFVSEQVGCEKPNRRFFETALRGLGIEQYSHVLVVGDGLESDIRGGKNAGLATCWYNPNGAPLPQGAPKPDFMVRQLEELYPIIMEEDELANVRNKNRKHQL